ncbi:MAG: hypothetical protein RLZZ338_3196 [Cyanobacteriota bacterium]|jgi:uncharacterized RDD family membrane protein YckC
MKFLNKYTFQTPESVELEFTLAGIGSRAYALFIDYIIWGISLFFWLIAWTFIDSFIRDIFKNIVGNNKILDLWLFSLGLLMTFLIYVGYFVLFETLGQGQTPGKKRAKIRVIRDDGRPVRLPQATLRALLRPLDDFLFIGFFLIVFNKQEKRLGDWVAGTLVIQAQSPVKSQKLKISKDAKRLAKELLQEADFSRLLPEDFAVIREFLHRRNGMSLTAKNKLSIKLALEVKAILALEKLPIKKMNSMLFLEAVYLGYQQNYSSHSEP